MRKQLRDGVLNMLKVREILRLSEAGLSQTEVSAASGVSRAAVQDYVRRAEARGVRYDEVRERSDEELRGRLGKSKPGRHPKSVSFEPNFATLDSELDRKGMTLALLWQEWSREHPGAHYSYATFCRRFNRYRRKTRVTLRQQHRPGEKLFVDYAGLKMPIVDRYTSEVREAVIFVAALGASYHKYADATESAELACWLGSHVRAFEFFGGVPEVVVLDNLKTGVTSACRYDPVLNRSYHEFAEYYRVAVLPARSNKPRDKAKVEKAVQDVERWVLAPLRDKVFHSVAELNEAMKPLLAALNERDMRDYGESPKSRFERFERETLRPLPKLPYVYGEWKRAKVNLDYHVAIDHRYYSVPYQLVGAEVEIRYGERTIEIFHDNSRVAVHLRNTTTPHAHRTDPAHMPPQHIAVVTRTADYFRRWAQSIGPESLRQVERILSSRPREEFGYRTIQGLKRLAEVKGVKAFENACRIANERLALGYRAVARVLAVTAAIPADAQQDLTPLPAHKNIRGPGYFH
jgi:transposase